MQASSGLTKGAGGPVSTAGRKSCERLAEAALARDGDRCNTRWRDVGRQQRRCGALCCARQVPKGLQVQRCSPDGVLPARPGWTTVIWQRCPLFSLARRALYPSPLREHAPLLGLQPSAPLLLAFNRSRPLQSCAAAAPQHPESGGGERRRLAVGGSCRLQAPGLSSTAGRTMVHIL